MIEDEQLTQKICTVFNDHKRRYGAKRIKKCLAHDELCVSRRRITRLMRENGLVAKGCRYHYRKYNTTHQNERPNLINQVFKTKAKNKIWFGDITYIPTSEGTLYLSVFIDLFTRKCIGYSLRDHMKETMVIDSLLDAIEKEKPQSGLIVHTDQGAQYTGSAFRELLQKHHFIQSNSRKGNPYDNAVMESFYKTFKREVLEIKQFKTKAQAKIEILSYVSNYYNNKRIHSSLDYLTPNLFEKMNS